MFTKLSSAKAKAVTFMTLVAGFSESEPLRVVTVGMTENEGRGDGIKVNIEGKLETLGLYGQVYFKEIAGRLVLRRLGSRFQVFNDNDEVIRMIHFGYDYNKQVLIIQPAEKNGVVLDASKSMVVPMPRI